MICLYKAIAQHALFLLDNVQSFHSFPLMISNFTFCGGLHSLKISEMIGLLCWGSSPLGNGGVELIFLSLRVLKCTLNFAAAVSFLLAPHAGSLAQSLSCNSLLSLVFSSPRTAVGSSAFDTHSSSLGLTFHRDSRALYGDPEVFICCP